MLPWIKMRIQSAANLVKSPRLVISLVIKPIMQYRFKAISSDGSVHSGVLEAESQESVVLYLQENGQFPLAIHEASKNQSHWIVRHRNSFLKTNILISLIDQMAVLVNAGMPLENALDVIRNISRNQKLRAFLELARDRLRRGLTLSDAFDQDSKLFPPYALNIMSIGQKIGDLSGSLTRLSSILQKKEKIRQKISNAIIYPLFIFISSFITIIFIMIFIIPSFKNIFLQNPDKISYITKFIFNISDFLNDYIFYISIFILVFLAICAFTKFGYNIKSFIYHIMEKIPYFSAINQKIITTQFSYTLGILLKCGLELPTALEYTIDAIGNHDIRQKMTPLTIAVRSGESLSHSIKTRNLLPKAAVDLIKIGEETGRLDQMLLQQAIIFEDESDKIIGFTLTFLTPVLTILMGGIVGLIVISMVSAILDINSLVAQ